MLVLLFLFGLLGVVVVVLVVAAAIGRSSDDQ